MDARRAYRVLAWCNGALGAGATVALVWVASEWVADASRDSWWVGLLILTGCLVVAVTVVHGAWTHWRRPSRDSAIVLGVNTAVLLGLIGAGLLRALGWHAGIGPAYVALGFAAGYAVYRLWLKPAAVRSFAEPAEPDEQPELGQR